MALLTGTVTGRFEDTTPGLTEPITGTVFFTAEADYLLSADSIVLPAPVKVELVESEFSVDLVATDDPTLNPVKWTYRVTFALKANGYPVKREAFSMKVPAGVTTDLASASPVASSGGAAIVRGPQGIQGPQGPVYAADGGPALTPVTVAEAVAKIPSLTSFFSPTPIPGHVRDTEAPPTIWVMESYPYWAYSTDAWVKTDDYDAFLDEALAL